MEANFSFAACYRKMKTIEKLRMLSWDPLIWRFLVRVLQGACRVAPHTNSSYAKGLTRKCKLVNVGFSASHPPSEQKLLLMGPLLSASFLAIFNTRCDPD